MNPPERRQTTFAKEMAALEAAKAAQAADLAGEAGKEDNTEEQDRQYAEKLDAELNAPEPLPKVPRFDDFGDGMEFEKIYVTGKHTWELDMSTQLNEMRQDLQGIGRKLENLNPEGLRHEMQSKFQLAALDRDTIIDQLKKDIRITSQELTNLQQFVGATGNLLGEAIGANNPRIDASAKKFADLDRTVGELDSMIKDLQKAVTDLVRFGSPALKVPFTEMQSNIERMRVDIFTLKTKVDAGVPMTEAIESQSDMKHDMQQFMEQVRTSMAQQSETHAKEIQELQQKFAEYKQQTQQQIADLRPVIDPTTVAEAVRRNENRMNSIQETLAKHGVELEQCAQAHKLEQLKHDVSDHHTWLSAASGRLLTLEANHTVQPVVGNAHQGIIDKLQKELNAQTERNKDFSKKFKAIELFVKNEIAGVAKIVSDTQTSLSEMSTNMSNEAASRAPLMQQFHQQITDNTTALAAINTSIAQLQTNVLNLTTDVNVIKLAAHQQQVQEEEDGESSQEDEGNVQVKPVQVKPEQDLLESSRPKNVTVAAGRQKRSAAPTHSLNENALSKNATPGKPA